MYLQGSAYLTSVQKRELLLDDDGFATTTRERQL
jgi:hypothetical protein